MAPKSRTPRPSAGRWNPPPKGPWSAALNAITPHSDAHESSVPNIQHGSSSLNNPACSDQLPHHWNCEKQVPRREPRQPPQKRYREPNLDIGVLQPIPSTECNGLPPATGITLISGITIRCGHGEELDLTKLSPSSFSVPNWDELGSVDEMQRQGWEGFQEWLQHSVLLGKPRRWKTFTNVAAPAMVYYNGSTPLGAVFFVQDHGTGYPDTAFTSYYVQIVISFVQLREG